MRLLVTIALGAAAATLVACADAPQSVPEPARTARALASAPPSAPSPGDVGQHAYSVQLHVHGSFSEGVGSIDSHSHEAADVGVDVVWWSDHDFRITSYGHASSFGFEGWSEPMPPRPDTTLHRKRSRSRKRLVASRQNDGGRGTAEFVAGDAREGTQSLRLRLASDAPEFESYRFTLTADRNLFKRPLASDVTLLLSVLLESLGPDARVVVDLALSEHAPREGLPMAPYRLRYVLGTDDAQPSRDGATFTVPVTLKPGEWNDLALPASRDAVRGFPFIHGEDNSLAAIAIGVEARRGAVATARFDDLRIEQELSGAPAFARQKGLIDAVARDHPGLTQLQGVEISWASSHLNEFSADTQVVDYDRLLAEADRDAEPGATRRERVTRRAVEDVHARGGLVSYNHMFGAMLPGAAAKLAPDAVLEHLARTRVFGADILEVGYRERGGRSLDDHLWVWDRLADDGLFLVGTGVSDSHGGPQQRWRTSPNNFVSWIYARSPGKGDLLDGLRAGRVFFGDRVLFDGTIDLTTSRGQRMGQVVVTDRPRAEVTIEVDGLARGDTLRVVESGAQAASDPVGEGRLSRTREVALDGKRPTTVRVAAYAPDGTAKVLSNPITFVPAGRGHALPPGRATLDVGGVRSTVVEGFGVTGAELATDGILVRGRGERGRLELDVSELGGEPAVELDGLAGTWTHRPPLLVLEGLTGEGTIRVRRGV